MQEDWYDFITSGERVEPDNPDYMRVVAINLIALVGGVILVTFIYLNFWVIAEERAWGRIVLELFSLGLVAISVAALRWGARIERVSRGFNIAFVVFVIGIIYARPTESHAIALAAMYPPVAFVLLDDARDASLWSGGLTLVLVAMMVLGVHPWEQRAISPMHDVMATIGIMAMVTLTMAGYVHNRRHALERLNSLREELEYQSVRDPLTGLFNRRTFHDVVHRTLAAAQRESRSFAILMLDIDNFKTYNDAYGHPSGDDVLRSVTHVLKVCFGRDSDVVFRLGGEEFCIVFNAHSRQDAVDMSEHTLERIAQLGITSPGGPNPYLSASAGLAWVECDVGATPQRVYETADRALYAAKREGRAQCVARHVRGPKVAAARRSQHASSVS